MMHEGNESFITPHLRRKIPFLWPIICEMYLCECISFYNCNLTHNMLDLHSSFKGSAVKRFPMRFSPLIILSFRSDAHVYSELALFWCNFPLILHWADLEWKGAVAVAFGSMPFWRRQKQRPHPPVSCQWALVVSDSSCDTRYLNECVTFIL